VVGGLRVLDRFGNLSVALVEIEQGVEVRLAGEQLPEAG
jgi:hypothetical protein